MIGATFLRQPLPANEQIVTDALRATTTIDELQSVWWRDAETSEGEARERLQTVYAIQLRRLGALNG